LKELLPSLGSILHIFLNSAYAQKVTVLPHKLVLRLSFYDILGKIFGRSRSLIYRWVK